VEATCLAIPPVQDLWLLAAPSQLSRARRFAEEAAAAFGFDDDESYDFKSAANEAVANAIEHGKPCADGTIRLRISAQRSALTLYVRDCGSFASHAGSEADAGDRGRGLVVMASMVDEVEVQPGASNTVVRLTKRRAA
jgi:anti-sigma regulatory factor (Ser/Thr protein kinase)